MTVQEAITHLLDHFKNHSSFDSQKDPLGIGAVCSSKEEKKEIFNLALIELEKKDIVRKGSKKWYLMQPLSSIPQDLSLSYPVCLEISKSINSFCSMIDDFKDYCDPLQISERDIFNLLILLEHYRESTDED